MTPRLYMSAVLRGSSPPFPQKSFPALVGVSEALTGNRSLWPSPAFGTLRKNPYNRKIPIILTTQAKTGLPATRRRRKREKKKIQRQAEKKK
jgi:hypothetical protein